MKYADKIAGINTWVNSGDIVRNEAAKIAAEADAQIASLRAAQETQLARIEELEAETNATVAAAHEAAAKHCEAGAAVYKDDPDTWQALDVEAAGIRALTPDDARAALDKRIAEAVQAERVALVALIDECVEAYQKAEDMAHQNEHAVRLALHQTAKELNRLAKAIMRRGKEGEK